jgi:hypothetical protein
MVCNCTGGPRLPINPVAEKVVSGHERCTNPQAEQSDCQAASDKLCRAHGLVDGASIDTQTEYCLEGTRVSRDCVFVTRAVCH